MLSRLHKEPECDVAFLAPDSLVARLVTIKAELSIETEVRFQFAGTRFNVNQSPWSLPDSTSITSRERLVHAVALVLYYGAYCRHPKDEFYHVPGDFTPDIEFVARLSQANQSRRLYETGWRLVRRDDDEAINVSKAGRYRSAAKGEYQIFSQTNRQSTDDTLYTLRGMREDRNFLPMFYLAHSETLPNQPDDRDNVRYYFHCDEHSVIDVMRTLTRVLNQYHIPFRIKCLDHPRLYGRSDALVLYIEKRYALFVSRLVVALNEQDSFDLHDSVPLFTKQLATGVGFAEDPGNGQSFGQHRTRLLAEAMLAAHESRCPNDEMLVKCIKQRFIDAGVNLQAPHLNPGSADWYECKCSKLNSLHEKTEAVNTAQTNPYGDAAESISRLLVRDAIWSGGQCNWLTQINAKTKLGYRPTVAACEQRLATGQLGIRSFLASVYEQTCDPLIADVLRGLDFSAVLASQNGIERNSIQPTLNDDEGNEAKDSVASVWLSRFPFYGAGVGPSADHVHLVAACASPENVDFARWSARQLYADAIRYFEQNHQQVVCFADPILADAFLTAARITNEPAWLEAAYAIGDHILEMTRQFGQHWKTSPGVEYPPLSLIDGLTGIGTFLLALAAVRDRPNSNG